MMTCNWGGDDDFKEVTWFAQNKLTKKVIVWKFKGNSKKTELNEAGEIPGKFENEVSGQSIRLKKVEQEDALLYWCSVVVASSSKVYTPQAKMLHVEREYKQ